MKNLKEQIVNLGDRMSEKIINGIGETSIKISEQARGRCILLGVYEPKIPIELLKEDKE